MTKKKWLLENMLDLVFLWAVFYSIICVGVWIYESYQGTSCTFPTLLVSSGVPAGFLTGKALKFNKLRKTSYFLETQK